MSRFIAPLTDWVPGSPLPTPPDPLALYERLKSRGMDFVTVTDRDSIAGGLVLAGKPDVFLSEEITTRFPDDGFAFRLLAFGITESDHEELQRRRSDAYSLLAALRERDIPHALSRPLAQDEGRLPTREQLERMMLLIPLWETRNGRLGREANRLAQRFVEEMTPGLAAELARRLCLPLAPNPLRGSVGGSDDISGLDVGRTYTQAARAGGIPEFLEDLRLGATRGAGRHGSAERRAHTVYSLAVDLFERAPHLLPEQSIEIAKGFARSLEASGAVAPEQALIAGLREMVREMLGDMGGEILRGIASTLTGSMKEALNDPSVLTDLVGTPLSLADDGAPDHAAIFRGVNARYIATMTRYASSLRAGGATASGDQVRQLGALIGFHLLLLPYLVGFFQAGQEKRTLLRLARFLSAKPRFRPGAPRIAVFTDTYHDTNGIVSILERLERWAAATKHDVTIVTASGDREFRRDGFVNLPVITEFDLSVYRDYQLHFPSCLSVLELAEREAYDVIHVVTPGPVGISALLAARLLGVPLLGSYHTQLPEYARILTDTESLERVVWEYVRYFYLQCERVLAPSSLQVDQLVERGFPRARLGLLGTGVDTRLFNPARRSDAFRARVRARGRVVLLYVGRISKEKNLDILADAYRRLVATEAPVRLVCVGEGPFRAELEAALGDTAVFTGILKNEELAEAYASADAFVFPSTTDTLGCVVLEAMASGLPVVVTDGGGARESVSEGETGLVVRGGDAASLEEAMRLLVLDPSRRRAMGRMARAASLEMTWDKAFEALYEEYEALTTSPERSVPPKTPLPALGQEHSPTTRSRD